MVEALILNRDAGFVRRGMPAVIKLEAYPFTRYGVLNAKVDRIAPDATVDQQQGLVFPMRVQLLATRLNVQGGRALLSHGMSVTAEAVTRSRRVIDLLWSPLTCATNKAFKEQLTIIFWTVR